MTQVAVKRKVAGVHSRHLSRGKLLATLEEDRLIGRLVVSDSGRFRIEQVPWESYWGPALELDEGRYVEQIDALHQVWQRYIMSGCRTEHRREYCFRYFDLLQAILAAFRAAPRCAAHERSLRRALGFECISLASDRQPDTPAGAATSTLRNPCYLLAKLRTPNALDDSQFLPLMTVADGEPTRLFHHYRQHKLSTGSAHSILLHLSVDQQGSFPVVNAIESQLADGADPRADERAARLVDGILWPYLRNAVSDRRAADDRPVEIEFVDLGSGSGILLAKACERLRRNLEGMGASSRFRAWLVDLSPSDPGRFFRAKKLGKAFDCLTCVAEDYRQWFDLPRRLPPRRGIRIALVSRFFNNLSGFGITSPSTDDYARHCGQDDTGQWWSQCSPSRCLASDGEGATALATSNSRLWLEAGRTFAQASLSAYNEGLHWLTAGGDYAEAPTAISDRVYLPLRSHRPEGMSTADGKSVLGVLSDDCTLIAIEDADLRPSDLEAHRKSFGEPGNSTVLNMTRTLGLRGHFSYVILGADDPQVSSLKGERLW